MFGQCIFNTYTKLVLKLFYIHFILLSSLARNLKLFHVIDFILKVIDTLEIELLNICNNMYVYISHIYATEYIS